MITLLKEDKNIDSEIINSIVCDMQYLKINDGKINEVKENINYIAYVLKHFNLFGSNIEKDITYNKLYNHDNKIDDDISKITYVNYLLKLNEFCIKSYINMKNLILKYLYTIYSAFGYSISFDEKYINYIIEYIIDSEKLNNILEENKINKIKKMLGLFDEYKIEHINMLDMYKDLSVATDFKKIFEYVCNDKNITINKLYSKNKIINSVNNNSKLGKYGAQDLTDKYYKYNPLVGRDNDLKKIIKKLLGNNSVIILGEAGVGKTAIVEGLAYNIKIGNVPSILKNKHIISIPISGITANTKYVGTLENHVMDIIDYAKNNKDTIFYFDEIHTILGAGSTQNNRIDISNMLKPYISNKTIQIIGTTTIDDFNKSIAFDDAFRRRFDIITLSKYTENEIFEIAKYYIKIKEDLTNVEWNIDEIILKDLVKLTDIKNYKQYEKINNPDTIIKIIDDIFANAMYNNRDYVLKNDIEDSIKENEILLSNKKKEFLNSLYTNEIQVKKNNKILKMYPH